MIRRLSHKLFCELLPFVELYSGDILLGPGVVPACTALANRGKRCEKNYLSVRRYVADPDNAYPKRSITKLILKGAVIFDVVSYQFRCALNYSKLLLKLLNQEYVARIRGKLIQKLLLNQKCMGYLVRAYYSISPTKYYKDDSCWSADLKSNTTEDVMAAPVIPISSDSSEESVGSHVSRVILFGAIPAVIPIILMIPAEVPIIPADPLVAPEVGAVSVTSPTGVIDLVDYSSSDSDPSKDSLPTVPELPLVSPFLCSDDSEADSKSEPAEQRPERHESLVVHDVMVSRWRVASRPSSPPGSSSHDTFAPSSEFPISRVVAPPGIRRRSSITIRTREAIPFGRPYRTHPNGPRKLLTARKRVRPFLACRLAWRRVSHHLLDVYNLFGL
ncbi:hypothetical protein Tco_0365685 [Tanacetum coccineum]